MHSLVEEGIWEQASRSGATPVGHPTLTKHLEDIALSIAQQQTETALSATD